MLPHPLTFLGRSFRRMYSLGDIPTMSAMYAVVVAIVHSFILPNADFWLYQIPQEYRM